MARYFGHYNESMVPRAHLESLGYHPYAYGYPWETVVKSDFTEKTTKLYVHGRQSYRRLSLFRLMQLPSTVTEHRSRPLL